MAEKSEGLEKGEYVIGIAIILAALLVSATVWFSADNLGKALASLKLTVPSGTAQPTTPTAPTEPAAPTGDWTFIKTEPAIGPKDAKVTVVEFSDYQCPYCAVAAGREYGGTQLDASRGSAVKIMDEYAKAGKAKFVYVAVAFFGQESADAANAAYCAREIGGDEGYFKMHDKLFKEHTGENEGTFNKSNLKRFGADIGFNSTAFSSCIDSDKYMNQVVADTQAAQAVGVEGTPNFAVNGQLLSAGAIPYATIKAAVDAAIASS